MHENQIRWGKVVWAGVLATIIGFVLGFFPYSAMNGVYESFGDLPYAKPIASIPAYLLPCWLAVWH